MLCDLYEGLNLHVHGLPKFMRHMNPDKMSSAQRESIVSILFPFLQYVVLVSVIRFVFFAVGYRSCPEGPRSKGVPRDQEEGQQPLHLLGRISNTGFAASDVPLGSKRALHGWLSTPT